MRIEDIEKRLFEINNELDEPGANLDKLQVEIDNLKIEKKSILDYVEERKKTIEAVKNLPEGARPFKEEKSMENKKQEDNIEVKSLQKYLINGTRNLTDEEQRSLVLSGAAAVVPTNIYNKLITDTKISDILSKATVINDVGPGKIYVPIASSTAASWKLENSDEDGDSLSYEKSPTLTKLELGGFELMRLLQLSGAAASMSTGNFENLMLELLGNEVVETLEKSFISGTGTGQPKGLDELTWTANTNYIKTSGAAVKIAAKDMAEALSLLPQQYARNAVVLVNSDMAYQMSQFKGTSEYAYNMAEGATKFLGKEIIVSEYMSDDTVYIVDPKELYVRFSMPLQIEADKSVGFKSASIYLRALTVVDAVWNPAAAVKVGLGA